MGPSPNLHQQTPDHPRLDEGPKMLLMLHLCQSGRDYIMLWVAAYMCFFGFMRAGELVVPL